MIMMKRRLACCTRDREISIDFDEQDGSNFPTGVMSYNGLKTCILNNQSYETESRISRDDELPVDSLYDGLSFSSKDRFGSLPSKWLSLKKEDTDDWETTRSPQHFYVKKKIVYSIKSSDVETMKEKFAKLLLGEDATGGKNGLSSAFVLSNAITNLAVTVFGELWKLEPLPEERKSKWRREMDWLLSPTSYMVELVPAKQSGANGCTLEIMTPKARADIHMNLPALQMLDSMLIEALDSMVDNEFWYAEGESRAEGRIMSERPSKRWWLPSPQVPRSGLSDGGRKKLMHHGRIIHQVLKAAKSINENVLLEMPVPNIIRDALPKSGRANLGDELYKILTSETNSPEVMLKSLNLKSEHDALNCINRLEAAEFAWKEKITGQMSGKSPMRTSWPFMKDPMSELDRTESLLDRAETLIQHIKYKYPNLPQTFLDATKIKYGKDVGHAVLEAYSRVLGNVAFSILSRIRDILQEDILSNPNSPAVSCCFPGARCSDFLKSPGISHRVRHSLIKQMNKADRSFTDPFTSSTSDSETSSSEPKTSSVVATPSRSRVWCIGKERCVSSLPTSSP